jgi:hypothetical protein
MMKSSSLLRLTLCGPFLLFGSLAVATPPADGYHLLKKVPLGPAEGGREYFDFITLDASTRRVYLSHGTEVKVLDVDIGAVVGNISELKQAHGIALVKELGRGFISDGGADRVVIFDLATLKVVGQVKTGGSPNCIIYDPASRRIFFNDQTNDSTVIDPEKETVVATIPMGGKPKCAVADGKGMIYVIVQDKNEVAAIDSRDLTIKASWPIAPVATAAAITMDREHRRLFIGGRNKVLAIMNADNGKIIQTFPIGDGVDTNLYEPETGLVFSSAREGTIHIFHEDSPDKFSEVETVKTEFGAKTMALDPKTHKLFLDTSDFDPPAAPTTEQPHPPPVATPGTFRMLIYGR